MNKSLEARIERFALEVTPEAIIDVFLDQVMSDLKSAARGCGYVLVFNGYRIPINRKIVPDIELIVVPWAEKTDDPPTIVRRICGALAEKMGCAVLPPSEDDWTEKPHGRRALSITLPTLIPKIDISIMPRIEKAEDK